MHEVRIIQVAISAKMLP